MGNPRGFLEVPRKKSGDRPVEERLHDYRETGVEHPPEVITAQASRCMDCGIPFCHQGCPLGNVIPEFNDHVYRGRMADAARVLYSTNNFPEVTGRVCPAPCEASCVLGLEDAPVTIKDVERTIANQSDEELRPRAATRSSGRRVAVVGSGPAGLACAQQLVRAGHAVVLFERDDRVGGLLRYGIPDFKLEKALLDRRLAQMVAEGLEVQTGVDVGSAIDAEDLRSRYDAVVLAIGSRVPRDLPVPGRELSGVHFAMEFLAQQNRRVAGDAEPSAPIDARDKHVVVIGGGDTGSDCVGTANRQGAASVTQLELMAKPPLVRMPDNPWPEWPLVMRTSSSHEEGCERDFSVMTRALLPDASGQRVAKLSAARARFVGGKLEELPDSAMELPADLVLLAMGFVGPERAGVVDALGLELDARGNIVTTDTGSTSVPGVFSAGDGSRGQSLVVWAIADGRRVAAGVDAWLAYS
jgi:glutamate synthase (NADPH) small chain